MLMLPHTRINEQRVLTLRVTLDPAPGREPRGRRQHFNPAGYEGAAKWGLVCPKFLPAEWAT